MRRSQLVTLLLVVTTFVLTACGQKGPLYLTDEQVTQAQETIPAKDTEENKEKSE